MSNMVPQTAFLNRVIWEHLESYTRNLVKNQNKKVFIVAGPVYSEDYGAIGPNNDIPVPNKNFKIIYILNSNQDARDISATTEKLAVIMPNVLPNGNRPFDNKQDLCNTTSNQLANDPNDWKNIKLIFKPSKSFLVLLLNSIIHKFSLSSL